MSDTEKARIACEALIHNFCRYADNGEAGELAELFTADGVFNRLGQTFSGREVIRDLIANRPRDVSQTHEVSNFVFELAADGCSAKGQSDLLLRRSHSGDPTNQEIVRARYQDEFVLSDDSWRIATREVVLLP
ncbi:MAG: nuclear transport factor 2 family protein [Gammaproteobacteria bacterium]|nr:nuclear transport factor 2 family protein [Gammaproteobacteria bacterium]